MTAGPDINGNSTPSPAQHEGNKVPESFYTKSIKPIQGKLIAAGVMLALSIFTVVTLVNSFKKDNTLKEMTEKLNVLEKERLLEHKNRDSLKNELTKSIGIIKALYQNDSLNALRIQRIDVNIEKIKSSYNEKFKSIDRFNSAQLLEYYRNLPAQNDY